MEYPRPIATRPVGLPLLLALATLLLAACSSNWVRWEEQNVRYEVRPGDTLYQIAFKQQLDYRDIAWWNGIGRDDKLYTGQILRLDPPLPGELRSPDLSRTTGTVRTDPAPGRNNSVATSGPRSTPKPRPARKPVAGPSRWSWPVKGEILAHYDPAKGRKGLDIGGKLGDMITAAAAGNVVYAGGALKGYGQLIIIKHGDDYLTAYGHNNKLLVREGDQVKAGAAIATMGLGPQNRPLLHFEIRRLGKPVNPEPLLP